MCGNIKVERGKEIVKKENWECFVEICRRVDPVNFEENTILEWNGIVVDKEIIKTFSDNR